MNEITTAQIAYALRCQFTPGGNPEPKCDKCPYHRAEKLDEKQAKEIGEDVLESCDIDKTGTDAADRLEELERQLAALRPAPPPPTKPKKQPATSGNCGYAPKKCLCSSCQSAANRKGAEKGCCDTTAAATAKWSKDGMQCWIATCPNYKKKEDHEKCK